MRGRLNRKLEVLQGLKMEGGGRTKPISSNRKKERDRQTVKQVKRSFFRRLRTLELINQEVPSIQKNSGKYLWGGEGARIP